MLRVPAAAPLEDVVRAVRAVEPSILGLSLTTRQWLRARDVVPPCAQVLDVPVIAGGLHPTFAPEQVLATPGFDYVCLAEGEEPMRELVAALARNGRMPALGIRNIWARGGLRPALRAPFEPIDALPFLARDLLDETLRRGQRDHPARLPVPLHLLRGAHVRRALRAAPAARAPTTAGAAPTRTCSPSWPSYGPADRSTTSSSSTTRSPSTTPGCRSYCELHRERVGVPFSLHARVETVNPELLQALAKGRLPAHRLRRGERQRAGAPRDPHAGPSPTSASSTSSAGRARPGSSSSPTTCWASPARPAPRSRRPWPCTSGSRPTTSPTSSSTPIPGTHLFKLCLERGYLPENYLELPAVHRASILKLPGSDPRRHRRALRPLHRPARARHVRRAGARLGERDKQKLISDLRGAAADSS